MKRKYLSGFYLALLAGITLLSSCKKDTDIMTSNVKTGGLVKAVTANIPYKLNATPTVDISVKVPKGPAITKVDVYNEFYSTADTLWTNKVLLSSSVINNSTINISIANIYAGNYQCVGTFDHPTAGVRDVNEEKFLTPINAFSCWANAGDLGAYGYFVTVTVDPVTNDVTCSTGPDSEADMANYPGEDNYYDPGTGEFHLSYFYVGGSGNRIMREVWTPIP
ncbi:MAG: DUF4361 domain-containing protein [Bacteroidia bacterium]|nr:DUF4361 domain-containing protein [Bacteroidia bacterium]